MTTAMKVWSPNPLNKQGVVLKVILTIISLALVLFITNRYIETKVAQRIEVEIAIVTLTKDLKIQELTNDLKAANQISKHLIYIDKEKSLKIKKLENQLVSVKNELYASSQQLSKVSKEKEIVSELEKPSWYQSLKAKWGLNG